MAWVIEGNAAGFAEFGRACLDPAAVSRVIDDSWHALNARAEMLERRRDAGFVRQCHGDLHLRNIVLLDRPAHVVRRCRVQRRDLLH
jgi:aminoglycoside phosphotransferase family enzyme